jgi:hypothetical protein
MLVGSEVWLCITKSKEVRILSHRHSVRYNDMDVCCSIFDMSRAPRDQLNRLVESFIIMVSLECNRTFDPAEYECLVMLLTFLCSSKPSLKTGVAVDTNTYYGEFSTIPRCNMCYVSNKYLKMSPVPRSPSTLVEFMMLGSCYAVSSIAE